MLEFYGIFPVVFSLIVLQLCHSIYRWRNPKCKGRLPPGSMGFPIIAETFEFMTPYDFSSVVSPYLKKRISRLLTSFFLFTFLVIRYASYQTITCFMMHAYPVKLNNCDSFSYIYIALWFYILMFYKHSCFEFQFKVVTKNI